MRRLRKAAGHKRIPGAVEKHSHADALALRIGEAFDASALGRHELVSLHHDACVRILGSSPGRGIDRGCTEITHARDSNQAARTTRWAPRLQCAGLQALVAELVDALG